jgi:hypothetical protein
VTRRVIDVAGAAVTIAPDDQPPLGRRFWSVAHGRALDEMTQEPPAVAMRLTSPIRRAQPRAGAGGVFGLVGIPANVFPALAMQSYVVDAELSVPGYVRHPLRAVVPQEPTFPAAFVPANFGDVGLHADPIVIRGSVVVRTGSTTQPAVGADVFVTEVWPRIPNPAGLPAGEQPNLIALRVPLSVARDTATGRVRRRNMTATGTIKALLGEVDRGQMDLSLPDRVGLNALGGDVLVIDGADPDRSEYVTVASITGGATAVEPAIATLTLPLLRLHRRDAQVELVTPQAAGTNHPLTRDAIAGDVTLFITSLGGMATATVVEITGGGTPAEFRLMRRIRTKTNNLGYYTLPPISRVAQVTVTADDGTHNGQSTVTPSYSQREYVLDLVIT